jgi:hypothetical protein
VDYCSSLKFGGKEKSVISMGHASRGEAVRQMTERDLVSENSIHSTPTFVFSSIFPRAMLRPVSSISAGLQLLRGAVEWVFFASWIVSPRPIDLRTKFLREMEPFAETYRPQNDQRQNLNKFDSADGNKYLMGGGDQRNYVGDAIETR